MILENSEATGGTHGHVNGLGNDGLKPEGYHPDDHLPAGLPESLVLSRSPEARVFTSTGNVSECWPRGAPWARC
jgi:hypothetical protein